MQRLAHQLKRLHLDGAWRFRRVQTQPRHVPLGVQGHGVVVPVPVVNERETLAPAFREIRRRRGAPENLSLAAARAFHPKPRDERPFNVNGGPEEIRINARALDAQAPAGIALTFESELGYTFDPAVWGQGFATEAVRCVRDYARDVLRLSYAISAIHPQNTRSRRLAERFGVQAGGQMEVVGLTWDRYVWPLATGSVARPRPASTK